jgi:hypothetical protein
VPGVFVQTLEDNVLRGILSGVPHRASARLSFPEFPGTSNQPIDQGSIGNRTRNLRIISRKKQIDFCGVGNPSSHGKRNELFKNCDSVGKRDFRRLGHVPLFFLIV